MTTKHQPPRFKSPKPFKLDKTDKTIVKVVVGTALVLGAVRLLGGK